MNKKTSSQVFDTAARSHIPDSVDLAPRIIAHIQKKKGASMQSRLKISLAVLTVILLFIVSMIGWPTLAQALQRLFGYLPGVGIVDLSIEPRKLAEPVSQTRDGITLTVESALLSADLTVIEVKVAEIPASAYPPESTPIGQRQQCFSPVSLRLPDGATLEMVIRSHQATLGSEFGAAESKNTWTLEPVPANIETATLVMPCILGLQPGAAPENWEVPLHFVPVGAHDAAPGVQTQLPVSTQAIPIPTLAAPSVSPPTQIVTPSETKKLTDCDTFCDWPVWSPDGRYIAYNNGDLHALWIMEADGGNPHLLSSTQSRFTWSPDGTKLAIISMGRLFVLHPDGTGLLALSDTASDWAAPVWSPDGKQIAFLAQEGNRQSLSIIAADGSNLQAIYNQPHDTLDQFFWLPDSRQIVFTTQTCSGNPMKCIDGFKLIDSDGNGLRSLYEGESMMFWFLSQDGEQIYILDYASGVPFQINLDGSGTAQLAAFPPGQWPPISPNGMQATYLSSEGYLEIMNLDGTERRTLVKKAIVGTISWSPDGKWIAFVSTVQGEDQLYVINADGSGLVNVNAANHPGYSDILPVWSPDGLHLAFMSSPVSPDQTSPAKSQIYTGDLPR